MEEDEGTTTNVEGRVIHHRQVVRPPAGAREDWRIICDLGDRVRNPGEPQVAIRKLTTASL